MKKFFTSVFSTKVGRVLFQHFRHECNCWGGGGGAIGRVWKMWEKHKTNLQCRKITSEELFFKLNIPICRVLLLSSRAICNFPSLVKFFSKEVLQHNHLMIQNVKMILMNDIVKFVPILKIVI